VLYAVACGSPVTSDVGLLVALAQDRGYDVCVVVTPDGRKFVDVPALVEQTGHPVRSAYKNPGDPDVLPSPDVLVVAPATVNTVNKWGAGIADTLALGLIVESQGKGLPIVVVPYTNEAMARHPAFQANIVRLRGWGITVLYGEDVLKLPASGEKDAYRHEFPWWLAVDAVAKRCPPAA
jgi:phosphopantothenoylcysteine synthetase/decarboxylase